MGAASTARCAEGRPCLQHAQPGRRLVPGVRVTTCGAWALRSLRSHAARVCVLKVAIYGAEIIRGAELPHVGQGQGCAASLMLRHALNAPQLAHQ
jgi:hypothetical protein